MNIASQAEPHATLKQLNISLLSTRLICLVVCALATSIANGQRAADNAVTAAHDAFGATVGAENIGLYSATSVRGFSPIAAGNVRIEGLYFDRLANLPPRLTPSSAIHVGPSAQGYAFPAPTGIVDYRLQASGDDPVLSIVTGLNAYAAPTFELDGKFPVIDRRLSLASGVSYSAEEYYDGADAEYWRAALIPRWRIADNVEAMAFWSLVRGRDEEVAPTIVTAGNFLPPEIPRRHYVGQRWADIEQDNTAYGALLKADVGSTKISGGVFRSINDRVQNFANVFRGTGPDGATREFVIADPRQRSASTSGELKASRDWKNTTQLHSLHVSLRGRERESLYGGSDSVDLGARQLGQPVAVERPDFQFGPRTQDRVNQWNGGIGYELRWLNKGEANLGLQHTDYTKRTEQPGRAPVESNTAIWLPSATLAVHLNPRFALYAGHTQGLEENGVAPDSAVNRGEALPALHTRQTDAGLRWAFAPTLKLIAGLFDVRKPYFASDGNNVYRELGQVQHRGLELSLAGAPVTNLTVIVGALLMDASVSGAAVDAGLISDRAVGQVERTLRLNADYRPNDGALSVDVSLAHFGPRVASNSGNTVPSQTSFDLGARYRFRIGDAPATLRIQAQNIADEFTWAVKSNNSFGLSDQRRFSALLYIDL